LAQIAKNQGVALNSLVLELGRDLVCPGAPLPSGKNPDDGVLDWQAMSPNASKTVTPLKWALRRNK
jgi:hypothetical protein